MFQIASQIASYAYDTFATPWTVQIDMKDTHERGKMTVDYDGEQKECIVFGGREDLEGNVTIDVREGRILEHDGITMELLGKIEVRESIEFSALDTKLCLRLSKTLAPPGQLSAGKHSFAFKFEDVDVEHESFYGSQAFVRYVLQVTVSRGFTGTLVEEQDVIIQLPSKTLPPPSDNPPIQMEVGIQDCLHIQFIYAHSHYTIDSILTCCVAFRIVRLNITSMEMSLVRVETVAAANPNDGKTNFLTTVGKMEFMDGAPARSEQIPVRWPLASLPLGPTISHPRVSVKYMLKLALVDEQGRQFFKQNEIVLHRSKVQPAAPSWATAAGSNLHWKDYAARRKEEPPGLFG